jgi:hypothetical protein
MNFIFYAGVRELVHFMAAGVIGVITYLLIKDKIVGGVAALWMAVIIHITMDLITSI